MIEWLANMHPMSLAATGSLTHRETVLLEVSLFSLLPLLLSTRSPSPSLVLPSFLSPNIHLFLIRQAYFTYLSVAIEMLFRSGEICTRKKSYFEESERKRERKCETFYFNWLCCSSTTSHLTNGLCVDAHFLLDIFYKLLLCSINGPVDNKVTGISTSDRQETQFF